MYYDIVVLDVNLCNYILFLTLFVSRKQQLHELRRLQREEARQQRELNAKAETLRNEQIKRFAADKEVDILFIEAFLRF